MNKYIRSFSTLIAAGVISFVACKKEDDEQKEASACVVTKISGESDYAVFEYDAEKRITKANSYSGGKLTDAQEVQYSPTQITITYYDHGVKEDVETYKVENGRIVSTTSVDVYQTNNGGGSVYTMTSTFNGTFEHNAEGYLTKETSTETVTSTEPGYGTRTYNYTTTYSYVNGNLDTKVQTHENMTETTRYEYYTDKPNTLNIILNDDEVIENLLSKPNKNLLKKETKTYVYSSPNQPGTETVTYTYETDASGKVTKATMVFNDSQANSGTETEIRSLEYSCK